ncbi:hypothetical protein C882_4391 [Caenispirillum salinarum AK4]|uniref:DUF488 domain-containing protein n=1 Tax=Caenispirillum salinarum AK4 TaxID=1238182 RepID=K9GYR2_9PROT|nr:DUF488 domain-containing protein [Caenispirillum salinarum]EKV30432.1 hypothetical protein C882_4391 [Caenispirillum salinarum AK4]
MAGLFTIGYEGASLDAFLDELGRAGVTLVVDVRDHPWSRRPEFCRRRLEEALAARGVAYRHDKALGNPKAGREAAKAGDMQAYRAIMAARLASATGVASVARIAEECAHRDIALLCMERNPDMCHRSIVAAAIHAVGAPIPCHLRPGAQLNLL